MAQAGDEYAAKSRQLLSLEFDRPTLSNVQAFLILGLHEFGSSRGARAWMYAGIAIRMAISLGLNVEDESKLSTQSWTDCEVRRRVFWAAFIMDRFSSSSSAQAPHFLREKDVQIQLPSSDYEFLNEIPAATEMLNGGYHPTISKVPGIQVGALDPTAYFIRYPKHSQTLFNSVE
jgi:Fungal specific transcription factor domain